MWKATTQESLARSGLLPAFKAWSESVAAKRADRALLAAAGLGGGSAAESVSLSGVVFDGRKQMISR